MSGNKSDIKLYYKYIKGDFMYEKYTMYVVIFVLMIIINKLLNKYHESLKNEGKALKKYGESIKEILKVKEREIYLMKTVNDAMRVTNTKGFIMQRMKNAPKHFEPAKEEEIKPDYVD